MKKKYHEEFAKITGTHLGWEDHGVFIMYLYVDYDDGISQGIGGHILDEARRGYDNRALYSVDTDLLPTREGESFGMEYIMATMETMGVRKWEDLIGKYVIVLKEDDSWGAKIMGFRGFRAEKPFIFKDLQDRHFPELKKEGVA